MNVFLLGSSRGMKWNNGIGGERKKVCHGRGVKQRPDNERSVSADRSCVGWLPFLETRLRRCALTSTLENKKKKKISCLVCACLDGIV